MRKLPILFLFFCSLLPLASSQQSANSHSGVREEKEVVNAQDALIDAYIKRDIKTLDSILADEYTFIVDNGTIMTKANTLASFKSGERQITSYKRENERVRVYGDTAVMTYRYHSKETYKGRDDSSDDWLTRIFVKRDGRWQIVGGHETRISGSQPDAPRDKGTIMELERQWAKAEEVYDPKPLSEILASDFVSMDETGRIRNKAQEIASDGEWKPPGPEVVDDMSVHLYGDTAICLGRFTWTDRNSGRVTRQGRFVDTFLRRGGRWQVVANSYIVTTTFK